MGCGGSKLNPEDQVVVPAKLRPLLRKRFEEMRRRKQSVRLKDLTTLSKKELLLSGVSDDDNNSSPTHSFPGEDQKNALSGEDKTKPVEMLLLASPKVSPAPSSENIGKENSSRKLWAGEYGNRDDGLDIVLKTPLQQLDATENNKDDKEVQMDDDEEEYDEDSDNDEDMVGSCMCPGSPSFRIYFIESLTNNPGKEDDSEKKSRLEDSGEISESMNSNESKKMHRKKVGRFRRVMHIPKRKPAVVRHLLNVTSCYNPGCSGAHHDSTRLLTSKPVA